VSPVIAGGILFGVALLLDAVGFGGWKDRIAFILIILGTTATLAQLPVADHVAGAVGVAVGFLFQAFGSSNTATDQALGLAIVATLLVLLGVAMLARDTPAENEDAVASRFHSRVSCKAKRRGRLNPRIWVVGLLIGLLAPQADFVLVLVTFAQAFVETAGLLLQSLGTQS
jgi:hypothetical protein